VRSVSLSSTQQFHYDRAYNSVSTGNIAWDYIGAAHNDNQRHHSHLREPLVDFMLILHCTGSQFFFDEIDKLGQAIRQGSLDVGGFRDADALGNNTWSDGEHDLGEPGIKTLIAVHKGGGISNHYLGTDRDYAHSEARYMWLFCLLAEVYRQNPDQPVTSYVRPAKETDPNINRAPIAAKTETTGADRYEYWHNLVFNHQLWKWNEREGTPGGAWGLKPFEAPARNSHTADGGTAFSTNYFLWLFSGEQKYEDAAKYLTDFYMDTWLRKLPTDLGRPGYVMGRGMHGWPDNPGHSSKYARPMAYFREDVCFLTIMKLTNWYRFADDEIMRRMHHSIADNALDMGLPVHSTWEGGSSMSGYETDRLVDFWDGTERVIEGIGQHKTHSGQYWSRTTRSRLGDSHYFCVMPWHDDGTHADRLAQMAEGVYAQLHGTSNNPKRISIPVAFLLEATIKQL
jgi:hypothetical protein